MECGREGSLWKNGKQLFPRIKLEQVKGIKVEDLIKDFAEDYGVDATDLYSAVQDLVAEDEKKCAKIDELMS